MPYRQHCVLVRGSLPLASSAWLVPRLGRECTRIEPGIFAKDPTRLFVFAFIRVPKSRAYHSRQGRDPREATAEALERELRARGHQVGREVSIPVRYKGEIITTQRVDMLADERIVVENKAGEFLPPLTPRQTLNYLRATTLPLALILHFGPEPRFYRIVCSRHRSSPGS